MLNNDPESFIDKLGLRVVRFAAAGSFTLLLLFMIPVQALTIRPKLDEESHLTMARALPKTFLKTFVPGFGLEDNGGYEGSTGSIIRAVAGIYYQGFDNVRFA